MIVSTSCRIAFLTTEFSPFQVELARAINDIDGPVEYRVFFLNSQSKRPSHWRHFPSTDHTIVSSCPSNLEPADARAWIEAQLSNFKPSIVISGGVRGAPMQATRAAQKGLPSVTHVGAWMEQPLPAIGYLKKSIKFLNYHYNLSKMDFVFAIGDRAHKFYRSCNRNTHFVPYGSDLSPCFSPALLRTPSKRLRILFSGGLVPRHDFDLIMQSITRLYEKGGDCFDFVLSGYGPEEAKICDYRDKIKGLKERILFDRDFTTWNDRLLPFFKNDVLLYTTAHAGWGLVVPEAMASGMPVIASSGAESARFLVENGHNGIMTERTPEAISDTLLWLHNNPQKREAFRSRAVAAAQTCHAPNVAHRFLSALKIAAPTGDIA